MIVTLLIMLQNGKYSWILPKKQRLISIIKPNWKNPILIVTYQFQIQL